MSQMNKGGKFVFGKSLLYPSKLGHILEDIPPLLNYTTEPGEFIQYKGRKYCWTFICIACTKQWFCYFVMRSNYE